MSMGNIPNWNAKGEKSKEKNAYFLGNLKKYNAIQGTLKGANRK